VSDQSRIWIDLDNTPHVPFFRPIIEALSARRHEVLITARDAYNVTDLLRLHRLECTVVGSHYGRNRLMKVWGTCVRAGQLARWAMRHSPCLAVSHGSRAQTMAAKLMRVPSVVIADYEHVTHITRPDHTIVPDLIPHNVAAALSPHVLTYPGIKEDVYASTFKPDPAFARDLDFDPQKIIVVARPPASEAHYHSAQSDAIFSEAIEMLAKHARTQLIVLPRNARQKDEILRRFAPLLADDKLRIPAQAVNGLDLIWASDLVISGGGTMNREAAALGVPVYSTFRGPIGAVDRYLSREGRLILLESPQEVWSRVNVAKRVRSQLSAPKTAALDAVVNHLHDLALNTCGGTMVVKGSLS
jgi:uncharacterized protein